MTWRARGDRDAMPLRVGLLGAGFIARVYAAALADEPLAEIVAVADPKASAVARCGLDCLRVDPDDLLDTAALDCVCVLTPHALHADQIERALRAGRHVITEKPLAASVERAEALAAIARGAGRHLIVRHYLRGAPFTVPTRDAIASGVVGRVHSANVEYATNQTAVLDRPGEWRGTWALGAGGVLMDAGVHGIDVVREVFGGVEVEACACDTPAGPGRAEDTAAVIMRLPGGGLGRVFVTRRDASTRAPRWRWEIIGDRARLEARGDWDRAELRMVGAEGAGDADGSGAGGRSPHPQWRGWWEAANRASVRAALQTIACDAPSADSAERAIATLRLVLRAYQLAGCQPAPARR